MKLENQVCSLELAQKLKSLGVKQESIFHWRYTNDFSVGKGFAFEKEVRLGKPRTIEETGFGVYNYDVSAFTVAELGELIKENEIKSFQSMDEKGKWCVWHKDTNFKDKNWANAFTKMLIYLLENKII